MTKHLDRRLAGYRHAVSDTKFAIAMLVEHLRKIHAADWRHAAFYLREADIAASTGLAASRRWIRANGLVDLKLEALHREASRG